MEQIDQETAKILFEEGGTIIFLGVPEGTEFGIDLKSWNTEENFRGVKMIPQGLHYIHFSSVGNMGDVAPRTGFMHDFQRTEILLLKWDKKLEDIKPITDTNEIDTLRANLKNLDRFLGAYPYDIFPKWKHLTTYLNNDIVKKLQPTSGIIRSALELVSCEKRDITKPDPPSLKRRRRTRPGIDNVDDDLLPDLKPVPGTELRLTVFPENSYPDGSTPAEITKHSLDSTYVLECLIKNYTRPIEIIGEVQFTFICFLVGHSLEAFEQWKRLVNIICSCELAITKYRIIFDTFLSVFEAQLLEVPEEFLADIVANNNFAYLKLRQLFCAIQNSTVDGKLKSKAKRFAERLSDIYFWDFSNLDEEDDDEAPVIVKL
ncbi:protein AAR2 homolog [Chrysoperla carnea]|uniref:protein AAR2 homolog n=1 Tax=Chrysoperla carnea TaxID=189513 RepID=UPI001D09386A|nr:protein AAR2 homolog [Chrysoperla carnea]